MKADWQKAKRIFNDALKLAPEERSLFLDKACGNDAEMRREVESLLSYYQDGESFLENPAVEDLAENETRQLKIGTNFAHYEILKLIGAGGMGEVYLARDTKLERQVAVKILNEKFSRHETNLRRFIREAKSASALNHPNILVIHEIGETDDTHYIVSEYVEGNTLREVLQEKSLALAEVFDITLQTANALSAAHEAQIIHRDIKPENIILRPDGYVKILDFGLAKLLQSEDEGMKGRKGEREKQSNLSKNPLSPHHPFTPSSLLTNPGVIMGTVNYMSPEQAKGEKVDERTDIFSLGVVLYEVLAGRTPFAGDSMAETLANLINQEPSKLADFAANVPDELQQIVSKMLRKKPAERYQTMKELLTELKEVRETVTLGGKPERKFSHDSEKATMIIQATTGDAAVKTIETQNVWQNLKSQKWLVRFVAAALLVTVVGFGYWVYINRPAVTTQTESTTNNSPPKPVSKIYWQMTEAEQLAFIRERAQHIHTLIGDEPVELLENELRSIKTEIDDYVEEKDSLSQKPFEEGLRVIYGRASQYAPIVIRAYEARRVAPALGLYQAMIESEYHDCPTNSYPTSPVGLFQFSRKTAAKYNLLPKDYCNIQKQADAAAHYMSDLASDFGSDKTNGTLGLLGFMIGENKVRDYLRQLRERSIMERSFWVILRSERDLKPQLLEEDKRYVPRFFSAAIIGETPEAFELSTPPLTTLRDIGK